MIKRLVLAGLLAAATLSTATAQQITLKVGSPAPPRSFIHVNVLDAWADAVERDSGGTLKLERFWGATLGNFAVNYDRVIDGVADIGWTLTAFTGGKLKQQDVAALAFETRDSNESAAALWKIYEKGVTAAEFNQVRLLALWTFPNAALHTKDAIHTLADLRNKKLSVSNAISGKMAVALGATPVTLRPDEVYQAVSRGTADGAMMPFTGMETFKIHEVARMHLDVALGGDSAAMFMNKQRFDSLPPQAKAAIEKNSYFELSKKFGNATQAEWERGRSNVKDTVSTLPAAEEQHWKAALDPVTAEWTKSVPDGAKVLEAFRSEIAAARGGK